MINSDMPSFDDALKILNIEDYKNKICESNSQGELFHLHDYIIFGKICKDDEDLREGFREIFLGLVKYAEDNWDRPESVYQHITKFFRS